VFDVKALVGPRSQQCRKRIEQGFGWIKTIGGLRKLPRVGLPAVRGWVTWTFATYNLIRLGGIGGWWDPSPTRANTGDVRSEGAQTGIFKPRQAAGGDGAIATSDWTRDKSALLNSLLEA
jgi:hypothetical protein